MSNKKHSQYNPYQPAELDEAAVVLTGTLMTTPIIGEFKIGVDKTMFIIRFHLAVQNKENHWDFVKIIAYHRQAYFHARALRKGDRVRINGHLRQRFCKSKIICFANRKPHHNFFYDEIYIKARKIIPLFERDIIENRLKETWKYRIFKDKWAGESILKYGVHRVVSKRIRLLYLLDGKFFSRQGTLRQRVYSFLCRRLRWYIFRIRP